MMKSMPRLVNFVFFVSVFAVGGLSWAARSSAEEGIAHGHDIAQKYCSGCHAIGTTGPSANPKSPPFRFLARKYPLSGLEEALAEGIMVGHEGLEMPQFRLDPIQIDDFLAYLSSIQVK